MSDQGIRSGETDEGVRLVNDDGGERLIQMLSVIASNVDRSYPESTDVAYTQEHTPAGTVVAVQGQHGFEQMSNLLTISVPSSVGHSTESVPTNIIHMDQGVTMVHHEVVVGSPDLSLADDSGIAIQPIAATDINLEDVHVLQSLTQKEQDLAVNPETNSKKMIFMTNYREYTISDVGGRICIGEHQNILSPESGCKMVPVTDVSTGHKFEYQYKHRGTVKRYEAKDMIIYFIGQISNERIRALYYQIVFQLVCKVGKVDLDIDYTSGRKVYSDYYSCFGPSTARTIRSPIEKLTYMKLLMLGDRDEACESDKSQTVVPTFGASKKLRNSKAFKQKRGKPKKIQGKPKVQNQPADHVEKEAVNAEESVHLETHVEGVAVDNEAGQPHYNDVPIQIINPQEPQGQQPPKKKRGRPRKTRLPDGSIDRGNAETSSLSERGSSKRRVKPPSRLSDYYDFTRKQKKEIGIEDDEEEIFSGKAFDVLDEPAVKKQRLVEDLGLQARSTVIPLQDSQDEGPTEELNPDQSAAVLNLPPIDDEVPPVQESSSPTKETMEKQTGHQENDKSEVNSKPVGRTIKKKIQLKQKTAVKYTTRVVQAPQKRGPGRPRKDDPRYKPLTAEDIDELVMQKKKYPSSHFQRAGVMKKYLCQACLTNHEKPVEKDGDMTECPILHAKRSFKDQAAATVGPGACSLMSLPSSLSVKVSPETRKLTVCAGQDIPPYTEFGPLVGILLSEDDIQVDTDLSQVWFLQQEDEAEKYFLYTGDENASNWCHYLTPVTPPTPYNTVMVLRDEGIFFTTSQKIPAGNELNVHVPFFGNKARPVAATNQTECLHCKRSFQSGLDYQKHYHIFHPGGFVRQKQKCRLCSLSFPGFKDLNNHMILKHDGEGGFQCDECPRTFNTPARLRVHKADVHPPPEAAVNCEKCGKVYRSKRALSNHVTNVHSEFKFACEVCGKWFDRRSTLLRHQRLHTGKFKHFCDRCGKGFRDLHNLKVHTLTHSGIRPFSCNFCTNTSFSTRTCLKVHYERLHKMTEDMMPELNRSIPFTLEAYSGALSSADKQAVRHQNKVIKLTAPTDQLAALQGAATVVNDTATTADLVSCDVKLEGDDDESAFSEVVSSAGLDTSEAQVVLPGESLLRADLVGGSTVQQHYVEMDASSQQEMPGMSMVVEQVSEGTETVETEQVSEGDHCYYALNVDGQQVLVPATEEVCVIVEDDNNLMYQTTNG